MAEPKSKAAAKCKAICPHFVVPDVVASAEHYRDVLGFKIMGYWLDPPVFAIVAAWMLLHYVPDWHIQGTAWLRLHRAGELTAIHIPTAGDEAVRDLVRAREDAVGVSTQAKQRVHRGDQLIRLDRLDEIRIGTAIERPGAVG